MKITIYSYGANQLSKASYLEKLGEPRELDGLHVELGEDGVHGAVVVDLSLEADELQRRLGNLEGELLLS